jgi:hypothetical protein
VMIEQNTPLKSLTQTAPVQVKQSEKKKTVTNCLTEFGQEAPEGFMLIDFFRVESEDEDTMHEVEIKQASTGTARPNAKGEQDAVINGELFKTLYRYRGSSSPERPFCQAMVDRDKLYRKEDIVAMSSKDLGDHYTNAEGRVIGWGPNGDITFDRFKYKGGGNCYHFWQKEVYMSIDGAGIDVTNPNARRIAVAKAERLGYKVRNEKEVAQLPIDMPRRGFLK